MDQLDDLPGQRPLRRLNANLLYALYALLRAPSLTDAAKMLSITQPAMSMSLRRLREHFGDEIVVYRNGRRLTALGEVLRERIGRLLREIDDTFNLHLEFDPATTERTITITAPEPVELMFLSRVVPQLLREAPGIHLQMVPFSYDAVDNLFERGIDIAIVPEPMVDPEFGSRALFRDEISVMLWDQYPLENSEMSLDEYLAGRHVALFDEIEKTILTDQELGEVLRRRQIAARTGLYSMLPHLVIGTNLIVTMSTWLAQHFASILPVRAVALPIRNTAPQFVAQWEKYRENEPVIKWMADYLFTSADEYFKRYKKN